MTTIVLPGDIIPASLLPVPRSESQSLKLGPGLRHVPPNTVVAVVAGSLSVDKKRAAAWIESDSGRYIPSEGDLVIATVHHSATDFFSCAITPHTSFALLPHLAFENVSKKTRPQLASGALVYARVTSAQKFLDVELTCVNASTGRSEGMGELKGGTIFHVSLGMARRLLLPRQKEDGGIYILEELAEQLAFEIAVGRNGVVWVNGKGVRETLLVGEAIQTCDTDGLNESEQKKLARKLLRELGQS